MNTETATTEAPAETIEYGEILWTLHDERPERGISYNAIHPEIGELYIYQYPKDGTGCDGRWLYRTHLRKILDINPAILSMTVSKVLEDGLTTLDAMQACLDSKDVFIEDIKKLSIAFGVGNYATGYMDGQAALTEKIKAVLP